MIIKKPPKNSIKYEQELAIWEKTIDVQMHFNELQMKIRNFSILLVSALVGAGGIALKEHVMVDHYVLGWHIQSNLSAVLFWIAALSWLAFFFMDHYWYYPLLVGSVLHGLSIERKLKDEMPLLGLTTTIGDASPQRFLGMKIRSKHKSFIFYGVVFLLLVGLAALTGWSPLSTTGQKDLVVGETSARSDGNNNRVGASTVAQSPCTMAVPTSSATTIVFNQEFNNGNLPASTRSMVHRSGENKDSHNTRDLQCGSENSRK
jgi:hypothetical protein